MSDFKRYIHTTGNVPNYHIVTRIVAAHKRGRYPFTHVRWADGSVSGIAYSEDAEGEFATIGAAQPEGCFAEIEDGTYGTLQGWRVILGDFDA